MCPMVSVSLGESHESCEISENEHTRRGIEEYSQLQ